MAASAVLSLRLEKMGLTARERSYRVRRRDWPNGRRARSFAGVIERVAPGRAMG